MLDALKRLAVIGVGAISMAEDEIQAAVAELRRKGDLSEEEGKKVLIEWRDRVEANRREIRESAEKAVKETVDALKAPTHEEFNELVSRVAALESKLGEGQR